MHAATPRVPGLRVRLLPLAFDLCGPQLDRKVWSRGKHIIAQAVAGLLAERDRPERTLVILLLLAAGGIWGFVELADEVVGEESEWLDRRILLAMRAANDPSDPIGPPWFEELVRDITALGGHALLFLFTLASAGYLLLARRPRSLLLVLITVLGGTTLTSLLKALFERPRPDLVAHGAVVYSASFPSGHSAVSAAVYLTLAVLLVRAQEKKRIKLYLLGWATLLTLLTGVSRVYLGVHWPSDVLAGWALGASWALLCWMLAWWWLEVRRHRPPTAPEA